MARTQAADIDPVLDERYVLEALIGEGGFGVVYRARQRATGQAVAIKVIKAAGNMGRRLARFARETRLCAELHHPHIVRLIDAHHTETSAWSAFELVPGCDLAAVLAAEGRLAPAEAIRLMGQVLDGLAAAHARGIVHRDLKPANVMVVPTGARRNALVLDFGIGALIEEQQEVDLTRLTGPSEPIGTPAYAAPEQLRGLPPTVRSDLYAWALTFLECLTGERAVVGRSLPEVILKQAGPDPVELPLELARHPLGRLLGQALIKDPVARTVSAGGLLTALDAIDIASLEAIFAGMPEARPKLTAPTLAVTRDALPTGEDLPLPVVTPTTSPSPLRAEEQRPVSLVSCVLQPTVDGPEADAALRAEVAVISEVARRHGGRVTAAFGDAVHVVFGLPRVAEDDPTRAARTSLAIAAESAERVAIRAEQGRPAVGVSVGLHCGSIIARVAGTGDVDDGPVVGRAARIAAELARRAAPGAVKLSVGARTRLARRFVLEDHGERVMLVGESSPIFALVGERSGDALLEGAMIGRAEELAQLVDCWRRAEAGDGRAVVLRGEAGIGKSRLMAALGDRLVGVPHRWLDTRCVADGRHAVLQPVVELMERLVGGHAGGEPPEASIATFADRIGLDPARVGPLLGPLLGLPFAGSPLDVSPARRRALTLALLVDVMHHLAATEPVVLAIEDLHWADATTLAWLEQLIGEIGRSPLLLLVTSRPGGRALAGAVETVAVERLDRAGVGALAARIAGVDALEDAIVDRLFERSDGIPLFVEEVVRSMLDGGVLAADRAGISTRPRATYTIPDSLEALLVARLDRLADARETARIAAVIGREVEQDLLERVDPRGSFVVRDALGRIAESGLMQRTWRIGGIRWTFRHALVRDAAHGSMPDEMRRTLHGRVADALISDFPDRAADRPEIVARHLAGAGRIEEAVQWSLRASGAALMRSASAEAIGHADEALAWLEDMPQGEARTRAELELNGLICPALMGTSGWTDPRIKAVADRSLALLDQVPDGPHLQRTIWTLMTYSHLGGRARETALGLAKRLLELADDPGARVAAHCAVANCLWIDGDYPGAAHHFERVLADYEPERDRHHGLIYGQDTLVWSGSTYAALLYITGHRERARALTERTVAHARGLSHAGSEALALLFAAGQAHYEGDRAATRRIRDEVVQLADRHGLPAHNAYAGVLGGWADGQPEAAAQCIAGLLYFGSELGSTYYMAVVAEAELAAGRAAAARTRLADVLARAAEMPEPYYTAPVHVLAARAALADGADAAVVADHLDAARQIAQSQGAAMIRLDAGLVGAEWRPGDGARRAELARALEGCPDPGPNRIGRARAILDATPTIR